MDVSIIYGDSRYSTADAIYYMEIVQLSLSVATIIAVAARAYFVRRTQPFFGAGLAAFVYMIQSVMRFQEGSTSSYYIGGYFFGSIISPILWCIAFDRLRAASSESTRKKLFSFDLLGVHLGYLWTFVIIITTVGVAIKMTTFSTLFAPTLRPIFDNALFFVANAPWGFLILILAQLIHSQYDIYHFQYSLYGYIIMLVIMNIGATIQVYYAYTGSFDLYLPPYEYPALPAMIASYIFTRFFGVIAIIILIARGHDWGRCYEIDMESNDTFKMEEQRNTNPVYIVTEP